MKGFLKMNGSPKPPEDLGFGNKVAAQGERLINRDGSFNIQRKGNTGFAPYMWLIETSWTQFFLVVFGVCLLINILFAVLFVLIGTEFITNHVSEGVFSDLSDAFFFSIQTFTTVGYGALNPHGLVANLISSLDALIGLLTFALATGLFFGRVSKPRAQIIYSENALLRPFNNGRAFMFRIVNRRDHKIINLKAKVVMSWWDTSETKPSRKFIALPLERDEVALLPLSWTLVSEIDSESPLFEKSLDEILAMNVEFIVQIEGFDQTFNQLVYSNYSYVADDLLWNHQFLPMFFSRGGFTELDLEKLNDTVEIVD